MYVTGLTWLTGLTGLTWLTGLTGLTWLNGLNGLYLEVVIGTYLKIGKVEDVNVLYCI